MTLTSWRLGRHTRINWRRIFRRKTLLRSCTTHKRTVPHCWNQIRLSTVIILNDLFPQKVSLFTMTTTDRRESIRVVPLYEPPKARMAGSIVKKVVHSVTETATRVHDVILRDHGTTGVDTHIQDPVELIVSRRDDLRWSNKLDDMMSIQNQSSQKNLMNTTPRSPDKEAKASLAPQRQSLALPRAAQVSGRSDTLRHMMSSTRTNKNNKGLSQSCHSKIETSRSSVQGTFKLPGRHDKVSDTCRIDFSDNIQLPVERSDESRRRPIQTVKPTTRKSPKPAGEGRRKATRRSLTPPPSSSTKHIEPRPVTSTQATDSPDKKRTSTRSSPKPDVRNKKEQEAILKKACESTPEMLQTSSDNTPSHKSVPRDLHHTSQRSPRGSSSKQRTASVPRRKTMFNPLSKAPAQRKLIVDDSLFDFSDPQFWPAPKKSPAPEEVDYGYEEIELDQQRSRSSPVPQRRSSLKMEATFRR